MENKPLHGNVIINILTLVSLISTFLTAIMDDNVLQLAPSIPMCYMLIGLAAAIILFSFSFKNFVFGFLSSALCTMISWRIAAIYNIENITFPLTISFILFVSNFIYCAHKNLKYPNSFQYPLSIYVWQLIFIRIYLGFDFVPHFTEKLFAGTYPRLADIHAFTQLGVPHPTFFVCFAGLCELGSAIGLCLGLFMRLSAVCSAIYLMVATYLGHHFLNGFIWAGPGGGWEFAIMWTIIILSFAITGAHEFSIDQELENKINLPHWVKKLM